MNELGTLVFQAKSIQDKIKEEKIKVINDVLNKNLKAIEHEIDQALLLELEDADKADLNTKFDEVKDKFSQWFNHLSLATQNELDSTKNASDREVEGVKRYIADIITKPNGETPNGDPMPMVKRVRIGQLVSVANKRIKTKEDIKKVLSEIEKNLIELLSDADEIDVE
jgi:hypothetical protein